jgi:hypothetical protein
MPMVQQVCTITFKIILGERNARIEQEAYSFDAKAENPDAGPDQIRAMVQTLLAAD